MFVKNEQEAKILMENNFKLNCNVLCLFKKKLPNIFSSQKSTFGLKLKI